MLPRIGQGTRRSAPQRRRALVICAHLRPGRDKRRSRYFMQPISGLHVGSLIDPRHFDVRLHHEDWHGPFDPARCSGYDLVFLSGLQPDFDRMRQLSYFFRRSGATVVAGGSICTAFPEFAARFFDVVCAGGVDSVRQVVADYLQGSLKPVYRSPADHISAYPIDHSLLAKSGINPLFHLMETSRGCSFKCNFCVIPAEIGTHARYDLATLAAGIEDAISASPAFSFRRWYPMINLLDNNFSDDRAHMLAVAEMFGAHPKVRGWSALVTQNVLHDRELIRTLARLKCMVLFAGLESLDHAMLRRYNKTQNMSRRHNVIDDVAFAESQGIAMCYGYLFDYRHQTAAEMKRQILAIARNPLMPMPVYLSVVAPLAGTAGFWEDLRQGQLAPNLRLRDLDGETICHSKLADRREAIVEFIEPMFRRPWTVVARLGILVKTLRRIVRARSLNPMRWYIIASANFHCFIWSSETPSQARTYVAGSDTLDPQYFERPHDLSEADRIRYFDPVELTDAGGQPAEWLLPYVPVAAQTKRRTVSISPQQDLVREYQP
jgi:hopanoid C-2 methylase